MESFNWGDYEPDIRLKSDNSDFNEKMQGLEEAKKRFRNDIKRERREIFIKIGCCIACFSCLVLNFFIFPFIIMRAFLGIVAAVDVVATIGMKAELNEVKEISECYEKNFKNLEDFFVERAEKNALKVKQDIQENNKEQGFKNIKTNDMATISNSQNYSGKDDAMEL